MSFTIPKPWVVPTAPRTPTVAAAGAPATVEPTAATIPGAAVPRAFVTKSMGATVKAFRAATT